MQIDTGRLTRRGKKLALVFVGLGLATFFVPLIKFDPPAQGREYWSIFETFLQLQTKLHPETPPLLILFLPFGLVYVSFLISAASIVVFPFRKVLRWTSGVGLFLLNPFRGLLGAVRLAGLFEKRKPGGDLTTVWIVLAIAMLAVAAVAWTDTPTSAD